MTDTSDIVLDSKHPDFENQEEKYELWRDLYEGGDDMEKKSQSALVSIDTTNTKRINTYLPQHPYESEAQYKIRKDRATYRNFAKPVTGVFLSAVWRKAPKRDPFPDILKEYVENVDLQGHSADEFFKEQDKQSAARGIRFVLVDSTKAPKETEIKTEADARAAGLRPYFVYVDVLDLIDWGFERNRDTGANELSYITIKETARVSPGPFQQHQAVARYKIWTRTGWEVWEEEESRATDKKKATTEPKLIETGNHPLKVVPIVPIPYSEKKEMVGESCFAEVSSLMKRIFCRDSELDKSLFDAAVPLLVTIGITQEDIDNFVRSSSGGLNIADGGDGADAKYVEPSGDAFGATRQAILDDERSIREIVLRIMRPDSKMAESAEAKRLDRQQLDNQLSNFAQNCERAETKCWDLALKWLNTTADIEIKYNEDFDIEAMSAEVVKVFQELRVSNDISRDTLWKVLQQSERMPPGFDPEKEVEQIEEDRTRDQRNNSVLQGLTGKFLTP